MTLAPGLTQWVPLPYGQFGALLNDPLGYHQQARTRFGDVFRFRIGPLVLHFLYHPDYVRHVLFDNPKNYLRGWQYRLMTRLFGDNLVASEGVGDTGFGNRFSKHVFHAVRARLQGDGTEHPGLDDGWRVQFVYRRRSHFRRTRHVDRTCRITSRVRLSHGAK